MSMGREGATRQTIAPRVMFVPVSGPGGTGEYMRARHLAWGVRQRWPAAELLFVLSREAPYLSEVPFAVEVTPTSPTHHIREVNRIVDRFRPDVVLFDCSGRAAQMRHAHRRGAATVFISQHRRKRRRGFKAGRMRYCDLHWIVQPEFVDGGLTVPERFKLKLFGRPRVTFLGPVYPRPRPPGFAVPECGYFFCCAGGGATAVGGRNSAELFAEAASEVAVRTGLPGIMVMGPSYAGELKALPGLRIVPSLDGAELVSVLGGARFALVSGGDLLGQAASLGIPAVAAPVGPDQPARIAAYAGQGLCLAARPGTLAVTALEKLTDIRIAAWRETVQSVAPANGLGEALDQLGLLLAAGDRPR